MFPNDTLGQPVKSLWSNFKINKYERFCSVYSKDARDPTRCDTTKK